MRATTRAILASATCGVSMCPALADGVQGWTGPYIGAHLGGSWGHIDTVPRIAPIFSPEISMHKDGVLGGLQGGYNVQAGPWVFGIEGTYSRTGIDGRASIAADPITAGARIHTASETAWIATLGGRIGFETGRSLIFAKAGAAWMSYDFSGYTAVGGLVLGGASASDTRSGWTIGLGTECALDQTWSLRLDYDYLDFGDKTYDFNGTLADISADYHVIRAGVTYRFGDR
ncbi:MAG: outer membrane protein [Hyphomicrobium sp.]|uniref:outer membrane protein n=1 Tax=Hyphomicrobium sp. TaxID=82 RepID=UPI003D130000